MTVRAKYFIEVGDIVSLRFECRYCKATLSMVLGNEFKPESLAMCPNCSKPWLALPSSSTLVPAVAEFTRAVDKLRGALADWTGIMGALHHPGVSMELEISGPPPNKE